MLRPLIGFRYALVGRRSLAAVLKAESHVGKNKLGSKKLK
jgi:hypothetical protein